MKKLLLSASVAASFGLVGCGAEQDIAEINEQAAPIKPHSRIVFDPANQDLNIPNDLLMIPRELADGTQVAFDFTLETEASVDVNGMEPRSALGALDGWSVQHPFVIRMAMPDGVELDASSLQNPAAIRIFEATQALEGTSAACQGLKAAIGAPGIPCELGEELTYGVDFVTSKLSGDTLSVVPLKPLKSAQGYLLVVTEALKDTTGRGVKGSSTWEAVRQDINSAPLSSADQLQLQGLVNALIAPALGAGVAREELSYAAYFTTQSAGVVMDTIKKMQVGTYAATLAATQNPAIAASTLPKLTVEDSTLPTAFSLLKTQLLTEAELAGLASVGLDSCSGLMAALGDPSGPLFATAAATFANVGPLCAASMRKGMVELPSYSGRMVMDEQGNPMPLTEEWKAACTNGAMLQSLGAETIGAVMAMEGGVGPYNTLCQQASGGQLFDLNLSVIGIEDPRHLTKYSPIPVPRGSETVSAQITIPDELVVNTIAASSPLVNPIAKPENGWPVVVLQHGVTSFKEQTTSITAALSLAGFATIAIDLPLHGERGMVIDGQTINAAGGHGGDATHYMNLSNLLVGRDNFRQSVVDVLGLRLSLHNVEDNSTLSAELDRSKVYLMGHSQGAILSTAAAAIANTSLGGELAPFDGMTAFKAGAQAFPGGHVLSILMDGAFGSLVKGGVAAGSNAEFQQYIGTYMAENGLTEVNSSVVAAAWVAFSGGAGSDAAMAELAATFAEFQFAAQTIVDSADPNAHAAALAATGMPLLMHEIVGGGVNDNGDTAVADQTVPNRTSVPVGGTEPLAAYLGLNTVVSTAQESNAIVRINAGSHSSVFSPSPSRAAMTEIQSQIAAFFATGGTVVQVSNEEVVAQ